MQALLRDMVTAKMHTCINTAVQLFVSIVTLCCLNDVSTKRKIQKC